MKNNITKASSFILLSLLLTGCSNKTILIDDFTVENAKRCARVYLKSIENKESLEGCTLKIDQYYGKIKNEYYVISIDFRSNNPKNYQKINNTLSEEINGYVFYWGFHFERNQGFIYVDNKALSLTEAYNNKIINDDDIKNYYPIYEKLSGSYNEINYTFTNYIK